MRSSKSVSRLRTALVLGCAATGLVLAAPASAMAAPPSPVTPYVSCYWANTDGSTTFSIGYTNKSTTVTYPVGALNFVTPAPQDRGQPTVFLAGTHDNVWAPTVTAAELASNPNWVVNGVSVSYAGNIPQCPSRPVTVSGTTVGYLTATSVIVGAGLFILAAPRRRRGLNKAAAAPVAVG